MFEKRASSAMLTDQDGTEVVQILHSGDAVDYLKGGITNLASARQTWTEAGGDDIEWDAAVAYVDSLPGRHG